LAVYYSMATTLLYGIHYMFTCYLRVSYITVICVSLALIDVCPFWSPAIFLQINIVGIPAAFQKIDLSEFHCESHYALILKKMDCRDASLYCMSLHYDAHPVIITSKEEQLAVIDFMTRWYFINLVSWCNEWQMLFDIDTFKVITHLRVYSLLFA